jgi:hypothetical protein
MIEIIGVTDADPVTQKGADEGPLRTRTWAGLLELPIGTRRDDEHRNDAEDVEHLPVTCAELARKPHRSAPFGTTAESQLFFL